MPVRKGRLSQRPTCNLPDEIVVWTCFFLVSQSIFKGNRRSKGLLNLLKPSINFSLLNVVEDHDSGFVISNININKSGMCITITLTGMSLSQQLEATLITTEKLLLFGVGTLFGI